MDSKVVKINDLLECPVCIETIISAPIFQCYIDHIVCKDCHPKLETCPICRDANLYDTPMTIRNQKLEEMFKRFQLSNLETAKMTSESIQIDIGILKEEYTYSRWGLPKKVFMVFPIAYLAILCNEYWPSIIHFLSIVFPV